MLSVPEQQALYRGDALIEEQVTEAEALLHEPGDDPISDLIGRVAEQSDEMSLPPQTGPSRIIGLIGEGATCSAPCIMTIST